jgi:LPXTG-motif cell wall-anchored protein
LSCTGHGQAGGAQVRGFGAHLHFVGLQGEDVFMRIRKVFAVGFVVASLLLLMVIPAQAGTQHQFHDKPSRGAGSLGDKCTGGWKHKGEGGHRKKDGPEPVTTFTPTSVEVAEELTTPGTGTETDDSPKGPEATLEDEGDEQSEPSSQPDVDHGHWKGKGDKDWGSGGHGTKRHDRDWDDDCDADGRGRDHKKHDKPWKHGDRDWDHDKGDHDWKHDKGDHDWKKWKERHDECDTPDEPTDGHEDPVDTPEGEGDDEGESADTPEDEGDDEGESADTPEDEGIDEQVEDEGIDDEQVEDEVDEVDDTEDLVEVEDVSSDDVLASTGLDSVAALLAGLGLVGAGGGALYFNRRRNGAAL